MSASASLIPELEEVIQSGSPEKCAETLRRITTLFVHGAKGFNEPYGLFDDVFVNSSPRLNRRRAELTRSVLRQLQMHRPNWCVIAHDNDIAVAGLHRSRRD